MMKLKSKRFCRSLSKLGNIGNKVVAPSPIEVEKECSEIKWELRPGGMLVQKRESNKSDEEMITIRVSTMSKWHDISIEATSTFGDLKLALSLVTSLEPKEQRLIYKGKERDDNEFLHMIGVRDKDKVLLLEDPAIKEMKLFGLARGESINNPCCTISV
ncbi:BAG family molecular chaperone regulator 2-like [Vicia villosa]|uniref:BAG family molecular chaperone regulator 2-like n=1 Tax=Vicia villosa TaxID=3911 RepID=UPI00273BD3F0|nr:BAG family molecular chaperone regulator 2-like [Vicia villosa]